MDFNETVFQKIADFIQNIGITVSYREISVHTFLPGLLIENGTLLIDKNQLKYVGDTLHEAGHIALMLSEERENLSGSLEGQSKSDEAATEMAVIAWTYAACLEIGINPAIVFHSDGYKGDSEHILQNFSNGHYFGVPILEWYGMTEKVTNTQQNNALSYPKMLAWMRT